MAHTREGMWERDGPWLRCKVCGFRVLTRADAEGHERFHSSPNDELDVLIEAYGPREAKRRWAEWQARKMLEAPRSEPKLSILYS